MYEVWIFALRFIFLRLRTRELDSGRTWEPGSRRLGGCAFRLIATPLSLRVSVHGRRRTCRVAASLTLASQAKREAAYSGMAFCTQRVSLETCVSLDLNTLSFIRRARPATTRALGFLLGGFKFGFKFRKPFFQFILRQDWLLIQTFGIRICIGLV